jgi:hypothetical protein
MSTLSAEICLQCAIMPIKSPDDMDQPRTAFPSFTAAACGGVSTQQQQQKFVSLLVLGIFTKLVVSCTLICKTMNGRYTDLQTNPT